MTIALVILHADPARGGAERYTVDLAAALARRGEDVSLLSASFGEAIPGVRAIPLATTGITRLGKYAGFLRSLNEHLAGAKYDIVHAMLPVFNCDVYHPHAGLAIESLARGHLKRSNTVLARMSQLGNHLNLKRWRFVTIERRLLSGERPPVVLCLSEYVKKTVQKRFPLPDSRLATLFNAVDLARFDPQANVVSGPKIRQKFGLTEDRVVALMIAHDYYRKGLREAILGMAAAGDARLALLVVGKQDPAEYQKLAADAGVGDGVIFAGATDQPAEFYQAADFFVLPTRHDPCSLVVLEALAMGVPVISTVFNGACEIMDNGRHGFVLSDPADVTALAESMRALLDGPRRLEMKRACLGLRPILSFDAHIDQLFAIYRQSLNNARGS